MPRVGPPAHWRRRDVLAQARRFDPIELLLAPVDLVELEADASLSK